MKTKDVSRELELKFNSGAGALLCPSCERIIAYGFDHDGAKYECHHCGDSIHVVEDPDRGFIDISGSDDK